MRGAELARSDGAIRASAPSALKLAQPTTSMWSQRSRRPTRPSSCDEEMRIIGTPLDFVGINTYQADYYVRATEQPLRDGALSQKLPAHGDVAPRQPRIDALGNAELAEYLECEGDLRHGQRVL